MADTLSRPSNGNTYISLYDEALAYETIWAIVDKMSPKQVEDTFDNSDRSLPTAALSSMLSGQLFDAESIRSKVQAHIQQNRNVANICVNGDAQYPSTTISDAKYPPRLFYYRGNIGLLYTTGVSIVGARKASPEGCRTAYELSRAISENGYVIVSGLAKGVDRNAHTGAIDQGGRTVAVIGTPINEYYPAENRDLQDEIARNHLLISHVPFYFYSRRDWRTNRMFFPLRNATMAAISRATVIVEASDTSGSLTQAQECLRQNRMLFIHERCFQDRSLRWPSRYVGKGAKVFRNADQILESLPDPTKYDD